MDDESIWQQLELSNEENFSSSLKNVSKFLASSTDKFKLNIDDIQESENEEQADSAEDEEQEEEDSVNDKPEEDEESEPESGIDEDQEENEEQSEMDSDGETELPGSKTKRKFRKSIVDDQFFKLSEMEEFLEREEQREMNPGNDKTLEVDMFTADDTNREESLKYSDFFDDREDDEQEEDEEDSPDDEPEKPDGPKSSFELQQERLQKKIEYMENRMLDERPWQMKGEVKADNRPQNSLLEEILEFDSTTRPAPIITEEVTMKLEDIIKQRIKDKAYDDVERKVKPSDIRIEYKKQLVLDQEKSKQSLAQIYEKEFIKELEKNDPNADDVEEEEPKEHQEIRADIKDLFEKLDLMSHFYYTPRPAQPELKIITNLPTIAMEEVAPVAVSEAAMLAPEEVKRKLKGEVLGAGERTKTDKNRERRHKKVFQREKFKKQTLSGKSLTEKVIKGRNVEKVKISLILINFRF